MKQSLPLTERTRSRILNEKGLDYVPNPAGLGYEIYHCMKAKETTIAQIDAETGESDSYGTLLERCLRTALKLHSLGISDEDIVCECTSNHMDACVPIIASLFMGIGIALIEPFLDSDAISEFLSEIKPKIIFISLDKMELIENAMTKANLEDTNIVVFGESEIETYLSFQEFLLPAGQPINKLEPFPISTVKNTAVVLFTSESLGGTQGICLSHYSLMIQAVNTISYYNIGTDTYLSNYNKLRCMQGFTIILDFMPYSCIWALGILNSCLLAGATRIICLNFDAKYVWQLIDKYSVDIISCTTFAASQLYQVGKGEGIRGSSLRVLQTFNRPLSDLILIELRKLLPRCFITNAYGQAEACGAVTGYNVTKPADIRDQYQRATSCGKLLPGVSCKIVDPITEKILGANLPGELRYKADFMMNFFLNHDSKSYFDAEDWLKTGELAYYDDDHRIYVLDPVRELVKFKRWHVAPTPLENILKEHPAVRDAAVIGIPDIKSDVGEIPMGIVTLKKGMRSRVTAGTIRDFVDSIVYLKQQLRGGVKIVRSIPRTLSGKPDRATLTKDITEGRCRYYCGQIFPTSDIFCHDAFL